MQQSQQFGDDDNEGAGAAQMEAMTRLTDRAQMANFLTYGKWNLDDELIEKLKKDEERKERVSLVQLGREIWEVSSSENESFVGKAILKKKRAKRTDFQGKEFLCIYFDALCRSQNYC